MNNEELEDAQGLTTRMEQVLSLQNKNKIGALKSWRSKWSQNDFLGQKLDVFAV